MTVTLNQLAYAQSKADTCQAVTEALADSTKVLSDNTIRDLLHFSEVNAQNYAVDRTVFHHVRSQHHENGRLKDQVVKIWNRQLALQQELAQIRKYCGFESADALKAAVDEGQIKPLPAPPKPAVHIDVNTADREKRAAEAVERAAKAKADAAKARAESEALAAQSAKNN